MGTSNWQNIPFCINAIRRINPAKVLDVGIGFGRWGILFREFLEVWEGKNFSEEWKLRIDGVEIFKPYIQDHQKFFYSNIFIEDALSFIDKATTIYDLIFFGDIIEHFEKNKGKQLVQIGLRKSKYVIINIPLGMKWKQGELFGNEYEEHKSVWYAKDLINKQSIYHKYFRDHIGRKFGTFIYSGYLNDFSFGQRFGLKIRFLLDNYPLLKSLIKKLNS